MYGAEHKAGHDRAAGFRRAPCITPRNLDRTEAPGVRHAELDVAEHGQQVTGIAVVAPVAYGARIDVVEPVVDRFG